MLDTDSTYLFSFIEYCLRYSGRHSVIINSHALDVLSILGERKLILEVFSAEEAERLRSNLEAMQTGGRSEISEELTKALRLLPEKSI